jgi:hypothetical protein
MFRSKVKKQSSGREFQEKVQEQKFLEIKLVSTCKRSPPEIRDGTTKKCFISSRMRSLQVIWMHIICISAHNCRLVSFVLVKLVTIIGKL